MGSSGFAGVARIRFGHYTSGFGVSPMWIHVGTYRTAEAAARARDRAIWLTLGDAPGMAFHFPDELPCAELRGSIGIPEGPDWVRILRLRVQADAMLQRAAALEGEEKNFHHEGHEGHEGRFEGSEAGEGHGKKSAMDVMAHYLKGLGFLNIPTAIKGAQ